MTQHAQLQRISVEDYLAGEEHSDIRHEYVAGQVFAMVGGTLGHNQLAMNLTFLLRNHLHGRPCSVYMSDVKVRIDAADAFYYPDVVVSCETAEPKDVFLTEPVLVIEVLSPSTENTDRREKLLNYQKLPGLKEYVLVSPDAIQVEIYRRSGDLLGEVEIAGPEDASVWLSSMEARLPLGEIYAGLRIT
ncbi:MAG: hypothetical protein AXA67_10970 [Methylothermaceae bacteria B42]|nr:MAG: hypothetical protein AXA67_10970 [Methylothermaceae bacteria B42]HHJ38996.1 Uma2 family endonuclease [Methylothermaceae bacterium]